MRIRSPTATALVLLSLLPATAAAADLSRYDSKYYTLYTDLDPSAAREAIVRMTHMADEYHERTKSFAGQVRRKFPFYLYANGADYYAAGGLKGSAGVFVGDGNGGGKLMAIAGHHLTAYTWHTVQHEGFHQFAHAVIGGDLPTWLNEGLAEYFGEGLFTGDGFVTGVVPPWRLQRLQHEIDGGQLKPVRAMMAVTAEQWANPLTIQNYDQAWSMVHFLVHADDGRYQPAFEDCIRRVSKGRPFDTAWADTVGSTDGFDQRWRAYWLGLGRDPTHALYEQANVATLTSFLARATAQRQSFPDARAFAAAADGDTLQVDRDDWLPHSMLADAVRQSGIDDDAADRWMLAAVPHGQPTLSLIDPDGTRLTGWFKLANGHVSSVNVEVDDTAQVLAAAAVLRDAGKKDRARAMVRAALQQHPQTTLMADCRALLKTCQ